MRIEGLPAEEGDKNIRVGFSSLYGKIFLFSVLGIAMVIEFVVFPQITPRTVVERATLLCLPLLALLLANRIVRRLTVEGDSIIIVIWRRENRIHLEELVSFSVLFASGNFAGALIILRRPPPQRPGRILMLWWNPSSFRQHTRLYALLRFLEERGTKVRWNPIFPLRLSPLWKDKR